MLAYNKDNKCYPRRKRCIMNRILPDVSTKEKIRNVAIDLFASKGYRDISVREIAKEVGIKASSLYKHYKNKEDILQSIFDLFKEKITQATIPKESLKQYIQTVSPERYFNESFAIFKSVMWSSIIVKIAKIITIEQQRNKSIREFFHEELIEKPNQIVQYVFEVMMENGVIDRIDARVMAEEYNSYVVYLYFEQNFLNESLDLDEIERKMNQHNAFYVHYLKKEEKE